MFGFLSRHWKDRTTEAQIALIDIQWDPFYTSFSCTFITRNCQILYCLAAIFVHCHKVNLNQQTSHNGQHVTFASPKIRFVHLLWASWPLHQRLFPVTKRPGSSVSGEVLLSQASSLQSSSPDRLQLQSTLFWLCESIPLLTLVDSGIDGSFIDSTLVFQANTEPITPPQKVKAPNEEPLATITHCTVPVTLWLSGNHRESIQLLVITSPHALVVLGLPCLKLQNFHIDWSANKVVSWSIFFHSHCLHSAIPSSESPNPVTPSPPGLSSVPSIYHDLGKVFSKQRALALLPHRPYDCAIDLLPGAHLPTSQLYKLSRPEREAMELHIKDCRLDSPFLIPSRGRVFLCH